MKHLRHIRDFYRTLSFRTRLLMLLIAVSLVQAGIAAYTFRTLQARPVDERVHAQLDGNLRAIAPVMDEQIRGTAKHLRTLTSDPRIVTALTTEPVDVAGLQAVLDEAEVVDVTETGGSSEPSPESGIAGAAYITDAAGEVVAGERPPGLLLEQAKANSDQLVRPDGTLAGTVHVPVVVDQEFIKRSLRPYVVKGDYMISFSDGEKVVGIKGTERAPADLREGLHEVTLGSKRQLALAQPVLDGSVLAVASLPTAEIAAAKRRNLSGLLGFIFVLVVMTTIESVAIARAVGDALRKFAQLARNLASGDLSQRIPVVGHDEVADLGESFNDMAENLEERIANLVDARQTMRRQVELFGDALANTTDVEGMLGAVLELTIESTSAMVARFWTISEDGHCEHAACHDLRPFDTEPSELERTCYIRNGVVHGGEEAPYWLVIPARSGDQIVGLMTLVSMELPFTEEDVRIASRLSVQAAVAIDNANMHVMLKQQATRDGLTGLPNHRALQDQLSDWVDEAFEQGMPLGVALLDIDNFKRINDTYGHSVGDEAIKALALVLEHGVGEMGMAGRLGGEEFLVVVPGCDTDTTGRIADRIREDIMGIEIGLEDGGVLTFTVSIGVTNVDQSVDRVYNAQLLQMADIGLYNAKRLGKNRIEIAGPDTTVLEMSEAERARLDARERGDDIAEAA